MGKVVEVGYYIVSVVENQIARRISAIWLVR